ncbi:MAG: hypothetical protein IPL08_11350 [Saprospiraceae bacterium]|nr:hypothetical protein [Saprospiraceae bacterium]
MKEISMIDYIFNTIFTMRNFKLFSFMLMAGMFLFLGGCQKDQEEKYKNKYVSTVTQNSEPIQEYVGLSKVLHLERYFRKNQQYFNSRSGIELDTSCISIVKFDDFYTTYSLNILKKEGGCNPESNLCRK